MMQISGTVIKYLPRPSIPRGLLPLDYSCLMFGHLTPLTIEIHILTPKKESASGARGSLLIRQPSEPRPAVVRERVTDAALRDDEIFRERI